MTHDTRTCTRCNGTGMRNTPVTHLGVPGLCYGCDGNGTQVLVPLATLLALHEVKTNDHLAELRDRGLATAAAHAHKVARRRTRAELDTYRAGKGIPPVTDAMWAESCELYRRIDARHAEELGRLREAYRQARDAKAPTRAKWCSPLQAADIRRRLR